MTTFGIYSEAVLTPGRSLRRSCDAIPGMQLQRPAEPQKDAADSE
jgi:hypothetical protein